MRDNPPKRLNAILTVVITVPITIANQTIVHFIKDTVKC